MKQYELRWATLPLPIGRRPVLLLTRTPAYEYLTRVTVAEITTTVRGIAQEVPVGKAEGLRKSVANLDNIHVIELSEVGTRIGAMPAGRLVEVKRALGHALNWEEIKVL